jgi:hypothetical protein
MDRRERRRRKRIASKIEGAVIAKKSPLPHKESKGSPQQEWWVKRYFSKANVGTKPLRVILGAAVAFLGAYATVRPNVSVEPDILLNPGDPFSTQFSIKNENFIADANDINPSCRTVRVITSHNVGMFGLPSRPSPEIAKLGPGEKSTITCAPWVGGLGAGAGDVLIAYIIIDISYFPQWWPKKKTQNFPFRGVVDSQKGVHWTHITLEEMQRDLSKH